MDQQIWQWTLTKEATTPCFVRDVHAMRRHISGDVDFFWLGHTPCRTVLLVGMVVGVQVYDKRSIYTVDDGTAVIDCVLRHPRQTLHKPKQRSPQPSSAAPDVKPGAQHPSPKKLRFDKAKPEPPEPPPQVTEPGYPVRVIGRVVRHYQSKQIYADTIDLCPSSFEEIAHLERVIELHKTRYSLVVPFVPPPKPSRASLPDKSVRPTEVDVDGSIFSNTSRSGRAAAPYSLPPPPPPPVPKPRNRPPSVSTHLFSTHHDHTRVPASPTASSIASSTPSSPCKPSSPLKAHEAPHKPRIRHPSRLHTGDLTGNTFRIYVKHYMDNAPSPYPTYLPSPSRSTYEGPMTPTKHARDEVYNERTPRPRPSARNDGDDDEPILGFTLSHLRRVPELALLAARVTRAEGRKRDKAERGKERGTSQSIISASARSNGCREGNNGPADLPRKKIKRLFSWAVVKLYEEGSIVLWDGDVRPLPVLPPPIENGGRDESGPWKADNTRNTLEDPSAGDPLASISTLSASASVLYASSASALLYSHYHPPRRSEKRRLESESRQAAEEDVVDDDADPGNVSDPGVDEEAYVPLTTRLLTSYVKEAADKLRRGQERGRTGADTGAHERGMEPTPEDILKYMQRTDGRWARVGVWAVEEALVMSKAG